MKEKITVLIADDNQEFSKTLATYLGNEKDMEVVGIAKDGVEAVEQIKELLPDVAILDVIMPHLDGLGVLEKINNSNNESPCPWLMLSYSQSSAFAPSKRRLGFDRNSVVWLLLAPTLMCRT